MSDTYPPALHRIATALERIADRLEVLTDGHADAHPGSLGNTNMWLYELHKLIEEGMSEPHEQTDKRVFRVRQ